MTIWSGFEVRRLMEKAAINFRFVQKCRKVRVFFWTYQHLELPVRSINYNIHTLPGLVMGPGQKFLTRVGSGQPFMVWVRIRKISPKNVKFFNFLPFRSKKIASGRFGRYPGQSQVGLLFTAGQKQARVESGQGPSLAWILFMIKLHLSNGEKKIKFYLHLVKYFEEEKKVPINNVWCCLEVSNVTKLFIDHCP